MISMSIKIPRVNSKFVSVAFLSVAFDDEYNWVSLFDSINHSNRSSYRVTLDLLPMSSITQMETFCSHARKIRIQLCGMQIVEKE